MKNFIRNIIWVLALNIVYRFVVHGISYISHMISNGDAFDLLVFSVIVSLIWTPISYLINRKKGRA